MRLADLQPACGLQELARRLEAKTASPNSRGCRLFTGGGSAGYGHVRFTDVQGRVQLLTDHRLAYMLAHPDEDLPDREVVRHSCDVSACVASDHLLRGSRADNSGDMVARARQWPRKLAPVREELCARYLQGESIHALARAYGVTQRAVQLALRRWGYRPPT